MKDEHWLIFWIVVTCVSNLLFIGVAVVVAVKGWSDLADLRRRLDKSGAEQQCEREDA